MSGPKFHNGTSNGNGDKRQGSGKECKDNFDVGIG